MQDDLAMLETLEQELKAENMEKSSGATAVAQTQFSWIGFALSITAFISKHPFTWPFSQVANIVVAKRRRKEHVL